MAAESLRDIPSDDDISVDENDPELLGELTELTGYFYFIYKSKMNTQSIQENLEILENILT